MRAARRPFAAFVALALVATPAAAEDRVTVRGVYYREPSTRVVQPMVQVKKDLPEGYDVSAHFLMDAITSASVAAGNSQDVIRTEVRDETGFGFGRTFDRTRVGFVYRYSHEPDYRSHTVGLSLQRGVWDNTGTLLVNVAAGRDLLGAAQMLDKNLTVLFLGAAYTQALSPTLSAQLVYDLTYQNGFLGNPYLSGPYGHENPPDTRLRHAIALRLAKYLPAAGVGFQAHGRLYFDQYPPGTGGPEPWHMAAGTAEARVYAMVRSDLEVRLAYRYHRQSRDLFWCPVMTDPACYHSPAFIDTFGRWSYDEKFGWLTTQYPELKLTWELEALEPVLRFLSRGAIEISYGYFVQSTHYRNAHVLQSGYSLPF